jgi:hypothetical protein
LPDNLIPVFTSGQISEGQKCEPFSATLNTIVPLSDTASSALAGSDSDDDDSDSEVVYPVDSDAAVVARDDDTEEFAPRPLNARYRIERSTNSIN